MKSDQQKQTARQGRWQQTKSRSRQNASTGKQIRTDRKNQKTDQGRYAQITTSRTQIRAHQNRSQQQGYRSRQTATTEEQIDANPARSRQPKAPGQIVTSRRQIKSRSIIRALGRSLGQSVNRTLDHSVIASNARSLSRLDAYKTNQARVSAPVHRDLHSGNHQWAATVEESSPDNSANLTHIIKVKTSFTIDDTIPAQDNQIPISWTVAIIACVRTEAPKMQHVIHSAMQPNLRTKAIAL